jgi:hypothetical protein
MDSLSSLILPIDSKPYGLTLGEWSVKWWQWLLSIQKSVNPAFDVTGDNANLNQNYPDVFFLCQTIEGAKTIPYRKITIAAGQSIFMPIVNWISILHIDGETDQELLASAKQRMDVIAELEITINEVTIREGLEKYRTQSPFFETALPEDNVLGIDQGPTRCVSDGYWIFLRTCENSIRISSFGSCSSGFTKIGVRYNITTI